MRQSDSIPKISHISSAETLVFVFLIGLLSVDALTNAVAGFSLPVFVATLLPSVVLAFLFPRAGLAAAVSVTVLFERFFSLEPIMLSDVVVKLYPLDIVLLSSATGMIPMIVQNSARHARLRPSDWLLLLFFAVVTVIFMVGALTRSEGIMTAFSTWKNYVFYGALFFMVTASVRTVGDLRVAGRIFLGVVSAATVFLAVGLVRGGGLWTEYTPLSTPGTRYLAFPHAFYFSLALLVLAIFLPMAGGPAIGPGRDRHGSIVSNRIFPFVLGIGILASLMRHLWIGLVATLTFVAIVRPSAYGRRLAGYLLGFAWPTALLLSLAALFFAVAPGMGTTLPDVTSTVRERVVSIGNTTDESLVWRDEVWRSAMSRFAEQPIFGLGFGASVPVEFGEYRQYVEVRNMHNSWLALLVQTGIVGTLVLGAFLVALVSDLFRMKTTAFSESARTVLAALLLFQGLVFFSQPYLETNLLGMFFWVTLGLCRALPALASRHAEA